MPGNFRSAALLGGVVLAIVYGCGTEGSTFPDGNPGGTSGGTSGGGVFVGDGGVLQTDAEGPSGDSGAACKTAESPAALQPIYLGFAFDVSGSMGQLDCPFWNHDPKVKWAPVVEATVAFFQDAASTNMNASMTLFPAKIGTLRSTRASDARSK